MEVKSTGFSLGDCTGHLFHGVGNLGAYPRILPTTLV